MHAGLYFFRTTVSPSMNISRESFSPIPSVRLINGKHNAPKLIDLSNYSDAFHDGLLSQRQNAGM